MINGMASKELQKKQKYFEQARSLSLQVHSLYSEIERLETLAESLPSAGYKERVNNPSRSTEAPFQKAIERIDLFRQQLSDDTVKLLDLMQQIHDSINTVRDTNERAVLRYRYISNLEWAQIQRDMNISEATALRWHTDGLTHAVMPDDPIYI